MYKLLQHLGQYFIFMQRVISKPKKWDIFRKQLMLELEKIYRVVSKLSDNITVCISIDGTNGQNGIKQVQEFNQYLPIDNIILNKMDGTAKGGILLAIGKKFKLPIVALGMGEKEDDLQIFSAEHFAKAIMSN